MLTFEELAFCRYNYVWYLSTIFGMSLYSPSGIQNICVLLLSYMFLVCSSISSIYVAIYLTSFNKFKSKVVYMNEFARRAIGVLGIIAILWKSINNQRKYAKFVKIMEGVIKELHLKSFEKKRISFRFIVDILLLSLEWCCEYYSTETVSFPKLHISTYYLSPMIMRLSALQYSCFITCLTDSFDSLKRQLNTREHIKIAIHIHSELCEASDILNEMFSLQHLMSTLHSLATAIPRGFPTTRLFIKIIMNEEFSNIGSYFEILKDFLTPVIYTLQETILLIKVANEARKKEEEFDNDIEEKVLFDDTGILARDPIVRAYGSLRKPSKFHVHGLFDLDNSLLLNMFGVAVMYIIYLTQFYYSFKCKI